MDAKRITVNGYEIVTRTKRESWLFNQGEKAGIAYQKIRSKKARTIFKIKVISISAAVVVAIILLVVWKS